MVGVAALARGVTGAGANVGLSVGSETWSFAGDLRTTGGDAKVAALSSGVRYHFGMSDVASCATLGSPLLHLEADSSDAGSVEGGGLSTFGGLGIDILRTRHVGGAVTSRFEMPTFRERYGRGVVGPLVSSGIAIRFRGMRAVG